MPEISVIIPTYNRGYLIRESIESVLRQTFSDFELLIIDDGSDDNTKEIVENIPDERIVYIPLDSNSGACHARNIGVEHAKGKYIAFQDSDDIWYTDKLEKQLAFLLEHDADMIFCQMKTQRGSREKLYPSKYYKKIEISRNDILKKFLGSTQTFFIRKECFKSVRFDENLPRYQDWEFLIQITKFYKVMYQPKALVIQRLSRDSISANPYKGFAALQYILNKYKNEYENCLVGKASILSYQASFMIAMEKKADKYLWESISANPISVKHWLKFILYKLGVLKFRYRR